MKKLLLAIMAFTFTVTLSAQDVTPHKFATEMSPLIIPSPLSKERLWSNLCVLIDGISPRYQCEEKTHDKDMGLIIVRFIKKGNLSKYLTAYTSTLLTVYVDDSRYVYTLSDCDFAFEPTTIVGNGDSMPTYDKMECLSELEWAQTMMRCGEIRLSFLQMASVDNKRALEKTRKYNNDGTYNSEYIAYNAMARLLGDAAKMSASLHSDVESSFKEGMNK